MPWQVFDHTADAGLRIEAPTQAALFEEAGRALASLIVEDPETVAPSRTLRFELEADDPADLLFDWLQALLVAFEVRRMLLTRFTVTLGGGAGGPMRLSATATGERADEARHRLAHEVKAITYHGFALRSDPEGWSAEVIVDI